MERWANFKAHNSLITSNNMMPVDILGVRLTKWLALRRVRTTLFVATFIITLMLSIHLFGLTTISHTVKQATSDSALSNEFSTLSDPTRKTETQMNWNDFAYVQYVTNENLLCKTLMMLGSLHRLRSKADRIMMYPKEWEIVSETETTAQSTTASKLLTQARDDHGTNLIPISVQHFTRGDPTWQDSFTKFLAFNQTQYKRIIFLDSGATIRQHMDELFLSPPSPVAMPRAYWLDQLFLSSQLILLTPSATEWQGIQSHMSRQVSGFDMDIFNALYRDSCRILPHRGYNIISGEFREDPKKHAKYLGSEEETWNGTAVLEEAKCMQFSDWPLPKPWIEGLGEEMAEKQPSCVERGGGQKPDCSDRDIWLGL